MTALAGWSGPETLASFFGLANSIDGSDGLFEPLVDGETNPRLAWEVQNKPIFFIFTLKKKLRTQGQEKKYVW